MNEKTVVSERDMSRRSVVRSATRAAWAVPVIATVSAAPAYAANSDVLSVTASNPSIPDGKYIDVTLTIENPAGGSLAANSVSVSFTAASRFSGASIRADFGSTWSVSGTTVSLNGTILNAGSVSVTIRLTFVANQKPKTGDTVSLSGVVTATDFLATSGTFATSAVSG